MRRVTYVMVKLVTVDHTDESHTDCVNAFVNDAYEAIDAWHERRDNSDAAYDGFINVTEWKEPEGF